MAVVGTSTFTAGQVITKALATTVNLQASHAFGVRVKNSSTSTTTDTIVANFYKTSTALAGSYFGRNNGLASTVMNVYRFNDSSATSGLATRGTCYGNTTTWYHLCFNHNATTGQIRFYIDGVFIGQAASATSGANTSTANTFAIAAHPGKFAGCFLLQSFTDRSRSLRTWPRIACHR